MSFSFFFAIVFVSVLLQIQVTIITAQSTRLSYPVIASVTPNFGSAEGGTWITIMGANFESGGLFTNRNIFVGGQMCMEIMYFTTPQRIVCETPKCVEPACLSDPNWQGAVTVSVNVYVQDVEAIYGTSSTFQYHGGYTPQIFTMSKNIRGGAISQITGRLSTDILSDIKINIGDNFAYIGDPNELNGALNMWSNSQPLYYKPPSDLTSGFYNLSVESQDDQSLGYRGTGLARMFPKQPAYDNWGFPYGYNWDCSLGGNVYNVLLQPVVSDVEPSIGSIGGGQLVTVIGSGFSKTKENNIVLVGGLPCDVVTAEFEKITCRTRLNKNFNYLDDIAYQGTVPYFRLDRGNNVTRSYGSPGWWVNVWNWYDYQHNQMTKNNIRMSLGWKNDMFFGLYYALGSSWPNYYNYQANNVNWLTFAADLTTFLIAPFSGNYRFYVSSDDSNTLYGLNPIEHNPHETVLVTTTYSAIGNIYSNFKQHMSKDIYLQRGQRYRLRSRLINTGGQDYLQIGLRIAPNMNAPENFENLPVVADDVANLDSRIYNYSLPTLLNSTQFLHHHSLKTIQIVSLQIFYQREIQVSCFLSI
jgi:hypothetical protein